MRIVIVNRPEQYWTAVTYFVSAMLIGNFMLLNLFLAILLKHLQENVIREEEEKEKRKQEALQKAEEDRKAEEEKERLRL